MTDRELLEAAAKAAELTQKLEWWEGGFIWAGGSAYIIRRWNPLADDGDAFRLAVKLAIDTMVRNGATWWDRTVADGFTQWNNEPHGTDPCAATRRAIVRAAAAIGGAA